MLRCSRLALDFDEERAVLVVAVQLEDAGDLVDAFTFFLDASVQAVQLILGGVEGVLDEGFVDQVVGDDVVVIDLEAGVDDDADQIDGTHLGLLLFFGDDFETLTDVERTVAPVVGDAEVLVAGAQNGVVQLSHGEKSLDTIVVGATNLHSLDFLLVRLGAPTCTGFEASSGRRCSTTDPGNCTCGRRSSTAPSRECRRSQP